MGNGYAEEGFTDREDQLNWDEDKKPVPNGTYDLTLIDAAYKLSKTNKHMVVAQFKITACHEPDTEYAVGRSVFENFVFAQGSLFKISQFAKAAGVEDTLPSAVSANILVEWAAKLMEQGVQVSANTTLREYPPQSGELKPNVYKYIPIGLIAPEDEPPPFQEEMPRRSLKEALNEHSNGVNGTSDRPRPAMKSVKPKK